MLRKIFGLKVKSYQRGQQIRIDTTSGVFIFSRDEFMELKKNIVIVNGIKFRFSKIMFETFSHEMGIKDRWVRNLDTKTKTS